MIFKTTDGRLTWIEKAQDEEIRAGGESLTDIRFKRATDGYALSPQLRSVYRRGRRNPAISERYGNHHRRKNFRPLPMPRRIQQSRLGRPQRNGGKVAGAIQTPIAFDSSRNHSYNFLHFGIGGCIFMECAVRGIGNGHVYPELPVNFMNAFGCIVPFGHHIHFKKCILD